MLTFLGHDGHSAGIRPMLTLLLLGNSGWADPRAEAPVHAVPSVAHRPVFS